MKQTRSLTTCLYAAFLMYCSMTITTQAAPGDVDLTFGNNGIVNISDCGGGPAQARAQADGKIVTVVSDPYDAIENQSFISRHNADGTPDYPFGNDLCGGGVRFFNEPIFVNDFVVAPDGKYLVAGYYGFLYGEGGTDLALYRFNSNGTLESQTLWHGKSSSFGERIALQSDGKVVVAGITNYGINAASQLLLVRFNPDGTLDSEFGTNGSVISFFDHYLTELLIQTDGKIVVAGVFGQYISEYVSKIVRYNSDGTLDDGFGTKGIINTGINGGSFQGTALQTDGKIVFNSRADAFISVIRRYDINGSPDISFGTNGTVSIDDPETPGAYPTGIARALAIQSNGKILTAGSRNGDFAISRYNSNGMLDTDFGTNGVAITLIGSSHQNNSIYRLALQPDGKVIALGLAQFNYFGSAMVRYKTEQDAITPTPTPTTTPATISGTISYGNAIGSPNPRFVSNVLINGAGSPNVSTTSLSDGSYFLTGFGLGTYLVTPSKVGGVNGITSLDAALIARHIAGVQLLTGNQLIVADVSGNGVITSYDAALVARYVAGLNNFGATGNWTFTPVNRMYPSVNSNLAGQDFIALLMGEVSGNWTDTGAR